MSKNHYDLSKFISEPANILERLYKNEGEELPVLTKEQFDKLPLNENYVKTKAQSTVDALQSAVDVATTAASTLSDVATAALESELPPDQPEKLSN